jgi:hypothetical protein
MRESQCSWGLAPDLTLLHHPGTKGIAGILRRFELLQELDCAVAGVGKQVPADIGAAELGL